MLQQALQYRNVSHAKALRQEARSQRTCIFHRSAIHRRGSKTGAGQGEESRPPWRLGRLGGLKGGKAKGRESDRKTTKGHGLQKAAGSALGKAKESQRKC